nr:unnamed protein product [Callosobruchus analis]
MVFVSLNDNCNISKCAEEIIVTSDIQSPSLQETGSTSAGPSNNSNVVVAEPCICITIDEDDDLPASSNDDDNIIDNTTAINDTSVEGDKMNLPSEKKLFMLQKGRQIPSSSQSCGSQLIEAIIKEKEKAANYTGKIQGGESTPTESMNKSGNTMSQGEIDKLYKKLNKNSFPWLDRNHTRRFRYLLQKRLVNRKLCDIVTDGLKRKQMCTLLDEELTAIRLEKLYLDGYLAKNPVILGSRSSVDAAPYLSRIQKERLQWFLNKELISNNYHIYSHRCT